MDWQEQPGWKESQSCLLKAALTYPLYLEKASNVPLKDLEGEEEETLGVFMRSQCHLWVQVLLGAGRGGVAGSHTDLQERQLSTPGTPRQFGIRSWLHHFLAVSFCAHDLTSLGL